METATLTFAGVAYLLPFAALVRPHSEKEREALKASIAETGVVVPVVTYDRLADAGGGLAVLDGATRLALAGELGLKEVPVEHLGALSDDAARALALSLNADRRHLSIADQAANRKQRVAAAVALKDCGLSTRKIAKGLGVSEVQVRRDLAAGNHPGQDIGSDNSAPGGAPSEFEQALRLLHNILATTRRLQKGFDQLSHTSLAQHATRLLGNHNAECALESIMAALADLAAQAACGPLDEQE